jgi:hypothetical protein
MSVLIACGMLAAMAIAGTAAASATVLCKTNTTPCSEKYAAGTTLSGSLASGTSIKFISNSLETVYTCTGGGISGKIEAAGSSSETARISLPATSVTWSGCVWPITTVKAGEMEVHWVPGSVNGNAKLKGLEISVDTSSIGFGTCNYAAEPGISMGTVTGGVGPTVDVSVLLSLTGGNFSCTKPLRWQATYALTSPSPLYVRES